MTRKLPLSLSRRHLHHQIKKESGTTLLEMLIVIGITATIISYGLPAFNDLLGRYRVRRAAEELKSAIYFTRSEAISRGGKVVLSKIHSTECMHARLSREWGCGWIVFVDGNGNHRLDPGEPMLQTAFVEEGIQIEQSHGYEALNVDRWGQFAGNNTFGFIIHLRQGGHSTVLCMGAGGRLRMQTDRSNC